MGIRENLNTMLQELTALMPKLSEHEIKQIMQDITAAKTVFVFGAGRMNLLLKCFAKRLVHVGIDAYVIGDTTTPPVSGGDLLIVASCSGETLTTLAVTKQAKKLGATIWGIVASSDSSTAGCCDGILMIPSSGYRKNDSQSDSMQPMNNLFDQGVHLVLDLISWSLQQVTGVTDTVLCSRHANIE